MICEHCSGFNNAVRSDTDIGLLGQRDEENVIRAVTIGHVDCVIGFTQAGYNVDAVDADGNSALTCAARLENTQCVEILLQAGANIDQTDSNGNTALTVASCSGRIECVKCLIHHKAGLDVKNCSGITALMACAISGHPTCCQILIDAGANVDLQDEYGRSALMFAAYRNNHECLCILIHNNAQVNQIDKNGNSALALAVPYTCSDWADDLGPYEDIQFPNPPESLNYLLEAKANVNLQDIEGKTVLMKVVDKPDLETVVQRLVNIGADVNLTDSLGHTALMFAIGASILFEFEVESKVKVITILIEAAANVNTADRKGDTALKYALHTESICLVRLLVKNGANVNVKANDGNTPLLYVCSASSGDSVVLAELLISCGADINVQNNDGMTAVTIAVLKEKVDLVRSLIQKGANVDIKNNKGQTPLTLSVRLGLAEIANLLICSGADVNSQDNDGMTAVMLAVSTEKINIVRSLIQKGANIDVKNNEGKTALMCSATKRSVGITKLLIRFGADVNAQDHYGLTALMLAVQDPTISWKDCLITNKTNLNLQDCQGHTVLSHALLAFKYYKTSAIFQLLPFIEPFLEGSDLSFVEDICHWVSTSNINMRLPDIRYSLSSPTSNVNINTSMGLFDHFTSYHRHPQKIKRKLTRLMVCNGMVKDNFNILKDKDEMKSALISSLANADLDTAHYLVATSYLSQNDLRELRQIHVTHRMTDEANVFVFKILYNPWPLGKLALIAVSSFLGPSPRREKYLAQTGLPQSLKNILMFQVPISRLSEHHWKDIPYCFDTVGYNQPLLHAWPFGRLPQIDHCECKNCRGKGYNFI